VTQGPQRALARKLRGSKAAPCGASKPPAPGCACSRALVTPSSGSPIRRREYVSRVSVIHGFCQPQQHHSLGKEFLMRAAETCDRSVRKAGTRASEIARDGSDDLALLRGKPEEL